MFLDGGVQVDEIFGQLIKSGSAVTIEREIRCYDGYELSCDVVGNITIEAKHDDDVSFTNVAFTPYDVSSLAGADETFQFRFTPGATAGVASFRFRYGPPVSDTAENVVFGSIGVNFISQVTFDPIYPQFLGEGTNFLSETVTFGD
jgi:hypothetical protein